jgi:glycosyltransferase 2 family protein
MEQEALLDSNRETQRRPARQFFKQLAGYSLAGACLVWVFYDIAVEDLWHTMSAINWWLIALAVAFDIVSYVCQGFRWQLLLRSVGPVSTLRATQAIYAGLFFNETLPLRIGELVRAYLVARWFSAKVITIIPSIAVERLFDAVWLFAGIGITALFIPLPRDVAGAAQTLGMAVLILATLALYLIFWGRNKKALLQQSLAERGWKPVRRLFSFLSRVAEEIRQLGATRYFYYSLAVSSLILVLQILAFWLVMEAYGLHLSLWAGSAVLLILHLGTVIPNAPSNVGTYQFFCVAGLTFFGVDKTVAAGFSMVVFIILTVPLWAIGLFAIGRSGMTLKQIRADIKYLINMKQRASPG